MSSVHPTALKFFEQKMNDHDRVVSCSSIGSDEHQVFRIGRAGDLPDVIVWYADAYRFGRLDFLGRPGIAMGNLFVLILPHADYADDAQAAAKAAGANIGMLRDLMGALNLKRVAAYQTEKERLEAAENDTPHA